MRRSNQPIGPATSSRTRTSALPTTADAQKDDQQAQVDRPAPYVTRLLVSRRAGRVDAGARTTAGSCFRVFDRESDSATVAPAWATMRKWCLSALQPPTVPPMPTRHVGWALVIPGSLLRFVQPALGSALSWARVLRLRERAPASGAGSAWPVNRSWPSHVGEQPVGGAFAHWRDPSPSVAVGQSLPAQLVFTVT
jgi:hypothetical protein